MNIIDGPYEKYLQHGVQYLSDSELLAMIIRSGTAKISVYEIANNILALNKVKNEGLSGLLRLDAAQINIIPGLGPIKSSQILCIIELARRISASKAIKKLSFVSAEKVADYYMERLRSFDRERVLLVCLNNKLQLISDEILYVGTINSSILSSRDVYVNALKNNASFILLLHNHPSGDPTPSEDDIKATIQIKNSGSLLQLPMLDHIIIGDNTYYSMKEHGFIN